VGTRNGIGNQEDKKDLEISGENGIVQDGLERCGGRHMPPEGQKAKKESNEILSKSTTNVRKL
jgi:hypothetical protein